MSFLKCGVMIVSKPTDFAYHLTKYLSHYLSGTRNFSVNTVRSYRDTFKLMIKYAEDELHIPSSRLTLERFNRDFVLGFLKYLETERHVGSCTINQRLSAIHAFCKYLQSEEPTYIFEYQRILAIPYKKYAKPMIEYLSKDALKAIFGAVDTNKRQGRRDLTLISVLYDTGARVQELCDLKIRDLYLEENPFVTLTGKGTKTREVVLMDNTQKILKQYINEFHRSAIANDDSPLFYNKRHEPLTRTAINHLINKYVTIARQNCDTIPKKVTPHIFRHTKAMHLVQAGVDMIYIRDFLGHTMMETTNIYARINIEQMRDALERAYPELNATNLPDWTSDASLMEFLNSL